MLILKPQIKFETEIVEIQKDYVVIGCSVVLIYNDGSREVIETFYQTISQQEFRKLNSNEFNEVIYLPGLIQSQYYETVFKIYFDKTISPFKTHDFLISQPTRAPNFSYSY